MSCPTCKQVQCTCSSPLGGILGGFSLVGGDYPGGDILRNEQSSYIVNCPPGITCEEGQYPIVITIGDLENPYDPWQDGFPIVLRVPCGDTEIVRTYPAGTSTEVLQAALVEMLEECGQTTADNDGWSEPFIPNTPYVVEYGNTQQAWTCPTGQRIKQYSTPVYQGVTIVGDVVYIAAGMFSSGTQAGANAAALAQLETFAEAMINTGVIACGYYNAEVTVECQYGDPVTVPADMFFSTVSQQDADDQAQAFGESECSTACNDIVAAITWAAAPASMSGVVTDGGWVQIASASGTGTLTTNPFNTAGGFSCNMVLSYTVTGGATQVRVYPSIGADWINRIASTSYSGTSAVNFAISFSLLVNILIVANPGTVTAFDMKIVPP